jgi:hypothetical protein
MKKHGILAKPAETAAISPLAFQQRARVYVRPRPEIRVEVGEKTDQCQEFALESIVVIRACCICGDTAAQLTSPVDGWQTWGRIRIPQTDDTSGLGKGECGIQTALGFTGQVAHFPSVALGEPVGKKLLARQGGQASEAAEGEPQGRRLHANLVFEGHVSMYHREQRAERD